MNRFVLHRHDASRPHYDLRLERDGVLKSWAVPRGLPLFAGVKRLAVEVEDHPLDYIDFEGIIPEGLYGAGSVEVWDSGAYRAESWEDGKIVFDLNGKRFSGRYILIRTGGRNWLTFKFKGDS
ncbi:MAG: ATP-dependent DNA ligase [Deltaproteobacteria bacterium]|nr:ATP-dependent DNA ligase [Deltaproteobacteria bacterium]